LHGELERGLGPAGTTVHAWAGSDISVSVANVDEVNSEVEVVDGAMWRYHTMSRKLSLGRSGASVPLRVGMREQYCPQVGVEANG
jgi:hypothetical protein